MLSLKNKGSLITYEKDGKEVALGYLFNFDGHGHFAAGEGHVEVTVDEANRHNAMLDEALLEGLDQCKVGQYGTLYFQKFEGKLIVTTWLGKVVSEKATVTGKVRKTLTFERNGRTYRGVLQHDADSFNFKRIK